MVARIIERAFLLFILLGNSSLADTLTRAHNAVIHAGLRDMTHTVKSFKAWTEKTVHMDGSYALLGR